MIAGKNQHGGASLTSADSCTQDFYTDKAITSRCWGGGRLEGGRPLAFLTSPPFPFLCASKHKTSSLRQLRLRLTCTRTQRWASLALFRLLNLLYMRPGKAGNYSSLSLDPSEYGYNPRKLVPDHVFVCNKNPPNLFPQPPQLQRQMCHMNPTVLGIVHIGTLQPLPV